MNKQDFINCDSFLSVSLLLLMRDYFDTAIILFGHNDKYFW